VVVSLKFVVAPSGADIVRLKALPRTEIPLAGGESFIILPATIFFREGKLMPVVLRMRGFRFWFYEADLNEPPHVHVGKNGKEAKYWLAPILLARSRKFREHELREIERILEEHEDEILNAWRKEQNKRGNC
jgi:hypothetical protein